MILDNYEQEYFANLEKGAPRRNGIRRAIDAALEKQDAEGALTLYHEFIEEDTFNCDNLQATLIFPEYLAYFEAHEEWQETFRHDVMWCFKWILANFYEFYQIPMEQIERIFRQYADFCKKYNYSLRTYYESLNIFIRDFIVPGETFLGLTAKEAFNRMLKAGRDELSDCKACELNFEFRHYLFVEDNLEKALEIIKPVFSGRLYCAEVPDVTYSALGKYYFEHNDLKNALKYATKSYRIIHGKNNRHIGSLAETFSVNYRIISYSEPEKAVKIMKELLPLMGSNQNAADCFAFFLASHDTMMNLEKAGYQHIRLNLPFKDETIYSAQGIYEITALKDFMYKKAAFYAGKLDARNGNRIFTDQLERKYDFGKIRTRKLTKPDIPVLQYIDEYLDNGTLPPEFSLPRKKPAKGDPEFVDGAMDGICFFHMQPESEELGELEELIRMAGSGKSRPAVSKTEKYFETSGVRTFNISDTVQDFIMEHTDELDATAVYHYAIGLTVNTKNYEAVKFGLTILELFSDYNDNMLEAIMKLAACDEFTLFCIWAVGRLENANDLIFKMAQHTNGWGKIFAVYYLKADTEEIKDWLLHYGVYNNIHPGYLANKCFENADVRELLKSKPDIAEMQVIAYIIYFLIEDGPTIGIKAYEDADEILDSFLENAERFDDDDADDENFFHIVSFIQNYRDNPNEEQPEE